MTMLLAAAVSLPAMVQAAEKLDYTVNVDYSTLEVDTVVHSSGEKFVRLDIAGLDNMAETNEPTLPVRMLTFEVPTYVNNFSVKLNSYTTFGTRTLPLALAPMECLTTNEAIEGVSNPVVYGAGYSATPTAPTAEVVDEYFVDGLRHFVTVRVTPVLYTHATKSVELCNRLSVSLAYDDCSAADMKFTPIKVAKGVQFAHRIDDSTLAATSSRRVNARAASGTLEPQIKEYLILTPDSLKEGVARLVAWKRQKGYNVKVQTFESIYSMPNYAVGSNANCFDEAASVREWMKKYYADNGAFYCLIIGNFRTSAPIRKFYFENTKTKHTIDMANGEKYVPTDVYFSDLVSNWDISLYPAGINSCKIDRDISLGATIPVGRLLCFTARHIQNFIDKLILYESFPGKGDSSYLARGLRVAHPDGHNRPSIFDSFVLPNVTTIDGNIKSTFTDMRPTAQEVLTAMDSCGIYSLACHGCPGYITLNYPYPKSERDKHSHRILKALDEYYKGKSDYEEDNAGLDNLTNIASPSFAYSLACDIAPFDDFAGWEGKEFNFVASFTTAGKFGGPAFVANTRAGWWTESSALEREFGKPLSRNLSLGESQNIARTATANKNYGYAKYVSYTSNVIGDPELRVWSNGPIGIPAKFAFSAGTLSLKNFNSKTNSFGIRCGNSSYIGTFNIAGNQSIYIPDFVTVRPNSILSVYIQTPEYLPETILIPTSDKLINVKEHYVLNNLKLCASAITDLTDGLYPPINLNLGKNCDLSLFVYNSVTSDKGITVSDKSTLTIESEKNVVFSGDKISNGGTLNVTADTLTLKEGFEIAKGSTFDFHNR